ncbi:hypothetical protein T484DRAFT_1981635 [Baffinella frigidus]|nr:hypothetical protein T484DRAFT_1981635 [Cryptophyta sp. CCMP2293]
MRSVRGAPPPDSINGTRSPQAPAPKETCAPKWISSRCERSRTKPKTRNLKPETLNLKPETRNTKHETRNTKHETLNLKP